MVLMLLTGLALASAALMRLSAGTEQVATGFRMQALALQAAEAALRHCEAQVLLPDAQRPAAWAEAALPLTTPAAPAWTSRTAWLPGALPGPPQALWLPPGADSPPWSPPVCLVERQSLDGGQLHVVTARGFSPDWRGDASAATLWGSSVWLQSIVRVDAGQLREKVQRRLLQPPVR